jgi:hypothetical protein
VAAPGLVSDLSLGTYAGMLASDSKPRLLLRFLTTDVASLRHTGTPVILKIYGDKPRGEGPLLSEWGRRGISVPRLETGVTEFCSWILMEEMHSAPMILNSSNECLELTDILSSWAPVMHLPAHYLRPVLRDLRAVMLPRWVISKQALQRTGRAIPDTWEARAAELYDGGIQRPLHGDLAPANIGVTEMGVAVVFDASALLGPPAFDAARWSARLAAFATPPLDVFRRWLQAEPFDDPRSYELLAMECMLEAGSFVMARSTPSQTDLEERLPAKSAVTVDALLDLARLILD